MTKPKKCPRCKAKLGPPKTALIICRDPEARKHIPAGVPVPPPGVEEMVVEFRRCTKCDFAVFIDDSYDIPDPLG